MFLGQRYEINNNLALKFYVPILHRDLIHGFVAMATQCNASQREVVRFRDPYPPLPSL